MSEKNLELYFMPTCPYCRKVLAYMKENDITMPLHDITASQEDCDRLVAVGGKRQVPCLFVDGKPMYESSDIIDYLSQQ